MAPGASLWALKVLNSAGNGFVSDATEAIDEVTARSDQIDVVNMSLGGVFSDVTFDTAISNSVAAGITYVVAAGNSAIDAATFSPANHPDVIAVSAISDTDGKCGELGQPSSFGDADDTFAASFSNFGSVIDMSAPGSDIVSTYLNGQYATLTGH